jgi:hypothetical protein
LLIHFVKLNQFVLLLRILNNNINFQLTSEKNKVDLKGAYNVLISEDVQDINQQELVLGKLKEFSPEYAIPQANSLLQTGMNIAAGAQDGDN